jgi:hypothetical protein
VITKSPCTTSPITPKNPPTKSRAACGLKRQNTATASAKMLQTTTLGSIGTSIRHLQPAASRPRLPIGTFGKITTTEVGHGRYRSVTRFRDWMARRGRSQSPLRVEMQRGAAVVLAACMRVGDATDSLSADSPFQALADAWLEDLMLDADRDESTKEIYERELRGLVCPPSKNSPFAR